MKRLFGVGWREAHLTKAEAKLRGEDLTAQEESYFSEVAAFIAEEIARLEGEQARLFEESVEGKRRAYEEHLEFKLGADNAVMQEQLMQNEALRATQETELRKLRTLAKSPYFARLDFLFSGEAESEAFYVGLYSLMDSRHFRQYILDWRSPLAGLYYDADLGPASYRAAMGTVEGELKRKLQILIRRGRLRRVVESGKDLHDDLLQLVLKENSTRKMKEIVASLQREQNRIIRRPADWTILLQGAAGTGKTSVALHRAAYLLYQERGWSNENLLLISPNPYFSDYVSEVLPQLGEGRILSLTFDELAAEILAGKEERFAEYLFQEAEPEKEKQLFDPEFIALFDRFLTAFRKANFVPEDISLPGFSLRKEEVEDAMRRLPASTPLFALPEKLLLYFRDRFRGSAFYEIQAPLFSRLWGMLQTHRLASIYEAFRSYIKKGYFRLEKEQEAGPDLNRALYGEDYRRFLDKRKENGKRGGETGIRELRAERSRLLTPVATRRLGETAGAVEGDTSAVSFRADEGGDLPKEEQSSAGLRRKKSPYDRADLRVMLALYTALFDFEYPLNIRHLIVDEFEDLGLLEHRVMANLFSASKTLIGDIHQNLRVVQDEAHLHRLAATYAGRHGEKLRCEKLCKAYRCSREIGRLCRELAPESEIEPVEREAGKVELYLDLQPEEKVTFLKKSVASARDQGYESIALLLRDPDIGAAVEKRVREAGIPYSRVPFGNQGGEAMLSILDLSSARGMEFDAVILWDAELAGKERELKQKQLYVAASRALHALTLFGDRDLATLLAPLEEEGVLRRASSGKEGGRSENAFVAADAAEEE